MDDMAERLKPEDLYNCCEADFFQFETTKDITETTGTIGQEKAMKSMDFGLSLDSKGFNIFALGENGTGKMRTVRNLLQEKASQEAVPSDWCYVYNFKDPDVPLAIALKPGVGMDFRKEMDDLVRNLRIEIPRVFESKEYESQRTKILEEFQRKQKEFFSSLEEEAQSKGFAIRKSPTGLIIVPIKKDGEPLTEEEFAGLDEKTRQQVEEIGKALQEKLNDIARAVRDAEKLVKEMLSRLEREIALGAVGHFIEELQVKFGEYDKVLTYLDAVQE
ncbi:MAG: Lon-like protease helical domain-containing protein, partial [Thermodesulfovibrionales bacterium]